MNVIQKRKCEKLQELDHIVYFTHYLIFIHNVVQFEIVIIDISDMYVILFEINL